MDDETTAFGSPIRGRHFRARSLLFEMLVVFVGITGAFLVENYRAGREATARAELVAAALYLDLSDHVEVFSALADGIDRGLASYAALAADGGRPVPYILEVVGALHPPPGVWESASQLGLGDLVDASLMFQMSFFFSESQGVADNFVRYTEFTEERFWPVALSDTTGFYEPGSDQLRGEFAAHMQRIRDYKNDILVLRDFAAALIDQLLSSVPSVVEADRTRVTQLRYETITRTR